MMRSKLSPTDFSVFVTQVRLRNSIIKKLRPKLPSLMGDGKKKNKKGGNYYNSLFSLIKEYEKKKSNEAQGEFFSNNITPEKHFLLSVLNKYNESNKSERKYFMDFAKEYIRCRRRYEVEVAVFPSAPFLPCGGFLLNAHPNIIWYSKKGKIFKLSYYLKKKKGRSGLSFEKASLIAGLIASKHKDKNVAGYLVTDFGKKKSILIKQKDIAAEFRIIRWLNEIEKALWKLLENDQSLDKFPSEWWGDKTK